MGISVPNTSYSISTPDSLQVGVAQNTSFNINASVRYTFNNQIFIQTNLSLYEFETNFTIIDSRKEDDYEFWSRYDFHYIQMPIYAGYEKSISKSWIIGIGAGFYSELIFSSKYSFLNDRYETIEISNELTDKTGFGSVLSLFISKQIDPYIINWELVYDCAFNRCEYPIYDDKINGDFRNNSFKTTLGIYFSL